MTVDEVRSVWRYDAKTGELIWNIRPAYGTPEGKVAGSVNGNGYRCVRYRGTQYLVHRVVWLHVYGEWPKHEVDHIDGNKLNNRVENLRDVPRTKNMQNQRGPQKDNGVGVRGVSMKRGRFCAQISVDRKVLHLGYFDSAKEAAQAYEEARVKLHPGYAEVAHV